MKHLIYSSLILLSSSFALGDEDLATLFQREHAYLISQKESLRRQSGESQNAHQARMRRLESEIVSAEKEGAGLVVKNDESYARVQRLEKELREVQGREMALRGLYKKAARELGRAEAELRFEPAVETEPQLPAQIDVSSFSTIRDRALQAIDTASRVEEARAHYRDRNGRFVESRIRRFGAVAAHALTDGGARVLGPSEEGTLAEIEPASKLQNGLVGVYVFDHVKQKATILKAPTIIDHFASFAPAALLAGLFALVGGLFAVLIRE